MGWGEEDVEKEIFEATGQYILQWWIQGWVGWGEEDVEKEIFEATGRLSSSYGPRRDGWAGRLKRYVTVFSCQFWI